MRESRTYGSVRGAREQSASLPLHNRRDFVALLGGAAAAWPLAARAQQPERVRRIGMLAGGAGPDDPDVQARTAAFLQVLQQSGWTDSRNMRIDYRRAGGDPDNIRKYAVDDCNVQLSPPETPLMSKAGTYQHHRSM